MDQYKYNITLIEPESITQTDTISLADDSLISDFTVNSSYDLTKDYIELHYYTLDGRLLLSIEDYKNARTTQDSETANESTLNTLTLQVEEDVINAGYIEGDINVIYNFLTDPYTINSSRATFFIEEISSDRTEIRLLSVNLDNQFLIEKTAEAKLKLEDPSAGNLKVNLGGDRLLLALNIDTLPYRENTSVVVKLYNPLPSDLNVKDIVNLAFEVADPAAYNITAELLTVTAPIKYIKGPNIALEGDTDISFPSQYLNIQDLYSYAFTGSYYQLRSIFEEKGAELSIDHSDYNNFINFSSAEERLKNFKYKLDLITTYQTRLNSSTSYSGSVQAYSGSAQYYESIINNILSNFDHYDRFLYYESGSFSWPKSNSTKPYTQVTGSLTGSWYSTQLASASIFDYSNSNLLLNTVPTFIKDDPANNQYSLFIHMVAQHFDNLWLYAKGISEKYNADNRLNSGISKDLIQDALRNFGIKLYNSNKSTQELFNMFTGEYYNTGSESSVVTIISGSNSIVSEEDYRKHIYKRLYHNLPLLLKSKGTERGIRALFSSFGVPSFYSDTNGSALHLYQHGGTLTSGSIYGGLGIISSSLDKIRLDNTGSTVGNTLSQYTSIVKRDSKYSQDSNLVEIGFSPTTYINEFLLASGSLENFSIDSIIGDPGYAHSSSYESLARKAELTFSSSAANQPSSSLYSGPDLKDFTRILKFYDNVIFKTVKDFIPAKDNLSSGIIIKPHILERNKVPQVKPTVEHHNEFSQSIEVGSITGSSGDSYGSRNQYTSSYSTYFLTSGGLAQSDYHNYEVAKYDGELSGSFIKISSAELNDENRYKYESNATLNFRYNFIDALLDCDIVWGQYGTSAVVDCNFSLQGTINNSCTFGLQGNIN